MSRIRYAVVGLMGAGLGACIHLVPSSLETPKLPDGRQELELRVRFSQPKPPTGDQLFVCGFLEADGGTAVESLGDLSCVDYGYFMETLKKHGPSIPDSEDGKEPYFNEETHQWEM